MKKLSLVFAGLLITFFVSWGIKVKMPVNRPDNTETASTVKWYETKYTAPVADDEWILDPEIPDNYVPVAGENEVYMVLDDSGNITGYRQRTQQEDGSWLWADVKNPNASIKKERSKNRSETWQTMLQKCRRRNFSECVIFLWMDESHMPRL